MKEETKAKRENRKEGGAWERSERSEEKNGYSRTENVRVRLSADFSENCERMAELLGEGKNYDIIHKRITDKSGGRYSFFGINGFLKDGEVQKLLAFFMRSEGFSSAEAAISRIPVADAGIAESFEEVTAGVLSGKSAIFGEGFGAQALLLDLRDYPARKTAEPESDRITQGARDGFVETLLTNTALIRRRVRDERLTMRYYNLGGASGTDVVIAYMDGLADPRVVRAVTERVKSIRPKSMTLGFESLAESLIRTKWYNPFPKIRTTERPDSACAHLLEGSVLVLADNSPQVMILPTSVFHFLQQTADFCLPPLTGSYLRLVRAFILLLSVISTPLWYLALMHREILPEALGFLIPESPGSLPILLQLYLAEIAIDGLKIASMNTPDILSNSLSIVGALILGDFVVDVGWLCKDVILYMAFVAIANFVQQNRELGYAFKFCRVLILTLTALADLYGFLAGILVTVFLLATNNTIPEGYSYLSARSPFRRSTMKRMLFRVRKDDFDRAGERRA